MIHALLFGFIFALGLILPLGPQNMFVIAQGNQQEKWLPIVIVVLTAALCDTILILIAVLGVGTTVLHIPWIKSLMLILGIGFLVYLGVQSWRAKGMGQRQQATHSIKHLITFTLAVSLLNPAALIDTIVTIGSVALTFTGNLRIDFTIGCIITSWLWFIVLALFGQYLQKVSFINRYLDKICAVVMWLAATYLIYQLIHSYR